MSFNMIELRKQILLKNTLLNSINNSKRRDVENIRRVQMELDSLLYQYYKQLKNE